MNDTRSKRVAGAINWHIIDQECWKRITTRVEGDYRDGGDE